MVNVLVGLIFFGLISWSGYKTWKSMRSNTCPGCSGGCSEQVKQTCKDKSIVTNIHLFRQ